AYYVSGGQWAAADAFRTSLRFAARIGVAGAAAGVLARLAVPAAFGGLSVTECAVAAAALPFALAWFYASYVALADDHYEAYVLPPVLQSAALLVLGVPLILAFGVAGAIVALLAAHVLTAAATVAWGRRRLGGGRGPAAPGRLRQSLAFGIKSYSGNALQVLSYRLDFFILSAVASTAVLGHYAVAVAVTTVLWLLPQALSEVVFPRVAALSADEGAEAHRAFVEAKSLRHATLASAVSAIVLAVALVTLVVPVYGPDFEDSIALGLIRLPGVALIGVAGTMTATIVGRGKPEYALQMALIATPLTLALYAGLIPWLEATGAALASSLSFAIGFALAIVAYRRATGAGVARRLLPTRSELDDYRTLWPKIREWALNRGGGAA
ncbi:MAG TPA: polysaccharide biosynthesis C-terminal domain-containing protein, partial [Solirubrobacter sp.]|nr:polysaccharide biosynthesis C-terminal domain-containing protein [Solirubrobacter sp.]